MAPLDPLLLNFRTQHTGAIFVLDQSTGFELPSQRVLLNARFFALYENRRVPDDASRRYPLLPVDMVFQPLVAGSTAGSTVCGPSCGGREAGGAEHRAASGLAYLRRRARVGLVALWVGCWTLCGGPVG